jgi:hypothetical protein
MASSIPTYAEPLRAIRAIEQLADFCPPKRGL